MGLLDWLAGVSASDTPAARRRGESKEDYRFRTDPSAREEIQFQRDRRAGLVPPWIARGEARGGTPEEVEAEDQAWMAENPSAALLGRYPTREEYRERQMNRPPEDPSLQGTDPFLDAALWGSALGPLAKTGVQALPRMLQTGRNIMNPNLTSRGFLKDAAGKDVFLHGTTRPIKGGLSPTKEHVVDTGYLSEGLYGVPLNRQAGLKQLSNQYAIRADPNRPGFFLQSGGKELTAADEGFYELLKQSKLRPAGTPTTHLYKIKGKPYVHGKMSRTQMKKVNASIEKILKENPGIEHSTAKRRALLEHGYESELFDPRTISKFASGSGKAISPKPIGETWWHPDAMLMAPRGSWLPTQAVALTKKSIAPPFIKPQQSLPTPRLLPIAGTQR